MRVRELMRKKTSTALNTYHHGEQTLVAREEMKSYCLAHPGSPSAVRRPQLSSRGDLWIALLGPSVEAALRAFDTQYFDFLGPATEATKIRVSAYSRT